MAGSGILIQVPGSGSLSRPATVSIPPGGLRLSSTVASSSMSLGGNLFQQQQFSADNQVSLVELGKRLLASARDGDTEEVRSLISKGAPFTTDWLGTSPLHLAAQYGHVDTCERLLAAGISKDARTKVDKTPLHIAAQEGHADVMEMLLKHGADVDAHDMLRMSPLHWAVERGNVNSVEMLLKYGADVNLESKFNKTPLEIASDNGRPDIYEMLQNPEEFRQLDLLPPLPHESDAATIAATNSITLNADGTIEPPGMQDDFMYETKSVPSNVAKGLKFLEGHGIKLLPEDTGSLRSLGNGSQTLSLTEAGKLALAAQQKKRPVALTTTTTTRVVTIGSASSLAAKVVGASPAKQPRIIKLSASQFAALKAGNGAKLSSLPVITNSDLSSAVSSSSTSLSSLPGSLAYTLSNSLAGGRKTVKIVRVNPSNLSATLSATNVVSANHSNNLMDPLELQKQLQEANLRAEEAKRSADELKLQLKKEKEESEKMKKMLEDFQRKGE